MTAKSVDMLFTKIQSGDKDAFEHLFKSLYEPLVVYAYKMVRNQEEAEEIVQKIFLGIWEKRKDLKIDGPLENYLYTATKYRSINYIKLELPKQQSTNSLDEIDISTEDFLEPETDSTSAKFIQDAIDQLPDKCRTIFILSRYSGLTYDEIAEELNLSVKTVENQIGNALKKLRVSLQPLLKKMRDV
jgi:RNA polymerase sigma-70 factor (ECF subfamily)